jgi:hypothetical protein
MQIGELAKLTNTSTKTIRFYEDSGLLPPPARSAWGIATMGPRSWIGCGSSIGAKRPD